jgi:hypothetical protein
MDHVTNEAGVTVRGDAEGWTVQMTENGAVTEQEFPTEELAEDFASSQRLRLGLVPQADLA